MKKSYFFKFFVFALVGALAILPSCKDYDDDISRLDKELNNSKTELAGVSTQLTAVKSEMNTAMDGKVKTIADDLAATKAALTASQAKLAALETAGATKADVDVVKAQIAAQKSEILEQTVSIEVLNTFKAQNAEEMDGIVARIDSLEKLGATKAELAALETEITGMLSELQASLDALDVRLTSLEKSHNELMAKHDSDLQNVIASIAGLKAELDPRIATIETLLEIVDGESGVLNGIADDLADQLTKIGANADAITLLRSDLEAELTDQLVLINANKAAIKAVETDLAAKYAELVAANTKLLAEVEANYNELDGKISLNKDAIDALELSIEAIEEEIEDIKDSITALEEDLNIKIGSLFTLAKNRLTSITLAPNAYLDGIEAVKFTTLKYRPMEAGENSIIPTVDYNMSIGAPAHASYKFNPRTFVLGNADYGYVNRTAEILTRATSTNIVEIVGEPVYKAADGTVNFTLRRLNAHSTQPTGNKENFIALEATLKGAALAEGESGVVITAPQELVYDVILDASNVRIADKATLEDGNVAHYPTTFDAAKDGKVWYSDMTYDKIYNLKEKVATCLNDGNKHDDFVLEDYNLSYKFSVASSDYDIVEGGTTTNQQEWIELVDANEGTFKAEDFSKEAIGRTPIMKVELVDQDGNVVRRAFVKVQIAVKKTEDILVGKSAYDLVLACEGTEAEYELNEMFIRENVYRIITNTQGETSMSHEEFWNLYDADNAVTEVTKSNVVLPGISQPEIVDGATGVGTATKKIVWAFDHSEVGSVGAAGSQLVATLTVKNKLASSEYPEHVTFRFVVNVTNPTFTLDKVENAIYWKNNMYQVNIAIPTTPQSPASAAVFSTNLPQAYSTYDVEFTPDVTDCVSSKFVVVKTFANGEETMVGNVSTPLPGVGISGNNITLDKNSTAVKTALNSEGGLQAVVQHVYTFANGDEVVVNEFMVNFIRPVTLNTQAPVSVTDAIDNGDVANFQWAGLLTDWRGNAIVAPDWDYTENCRGWWQFDHIMEYEYVPGYQRVKTAASVNVTYGEVSFTTGGSTTMYEGEVNWKIERRSRTAGYVWGQGWYWNDWTPWATNPGQGNTGTFTTDNPKLTESEVELFLQPLVDGIPVPSNYTSNDYTTQYEFQLVVEDPVITTTTVPGGQLVEYTYVQSITYVPAVYENVPGRWIPQEYEPTDRPNVDGTADGERNGDWVWKERCLTWLDYTPGQYWNFYGPFGQLTAHFNQVTTSLDYNDNQLPVNVTLTQVGNTVKYVNVGAPISESYEIYIPATITYGWGKLETVLTIVVVPAV